MCELMLLYSSHVDVRSDILSMIRRIRKIIKDVKVHITEALTERFFIKPRIFVLGSGKDLEIDLLTILSHHHDGEHMIFIYKPERKDLGSIDDLKEKIIERFRIHERKGIVVISIDRETREIENLLLSFENRLKRCGITVIGKEKKHDFLMSYKCSLLNREFQIYCLVNAVGKYRKEAVGSYFVEILRLRTLPDLVITDLIKYWINKGKKYYDEVIRYMIIDKDLVKDLAASHWITFELLKSDNE